MVVVSSSSSSSSSIVVVVVVVVVVAATSAPVIVVAKAHNRTSLAIIPNFCQQEMLANSLTIFGHFQQENK